MDRNEELNFNDSRLNKSSEYLIFISTGIRTGVDVGKEKENRAH